MRHTSKTSRRPHASHSLPVGTCGVNCCLHRACRLHTQCLHQRNQTLNFMKFLFNVFTFLPFFLSFFLFVFPTLVPPTLCHQTDKKDFFLPCFSARLPSCPEALKYLVSSIATNVSPLSARSKNMIGEGHKKEKNKGGGVRSRSLVAKILCGAR